MKKFLMFFTLTFLLLGLVACKDNKKPDNTGKTTEPPVVDAKPQFNSTVVLSGEHVNGLKIIASAKDTDAKIYFIVIDKDAANPTAAQVKAGSNYGSVTVHAKGSETGTLSIEQTEGLTGGTEYKVAFVLERNSLFSDVLTRGGKATSSGDLIDKGDGTEENPFWIETVADLEKIGTGTDEWHPVSHYILKNDLDLEAAGYKEGGKSWTPIGKQESLTAPVKLDGSFDGNGFTISNLYINHTTKGEKVGLFSELDVNGVIKNLNLTDVNITANAFRVGAIVGYSKGHIENVSVVGGTITAIETADSQVGGVVGAIYEVGSITKAYTNVDIFASGRRAGGIAGSVDASNASTENIVIKDVYTLGNVTGTTKDARQMAGIIGSARNFDLINAYAAGNITGSAQIGGIIGFAQRRDANTYVDALVIKNVFYIGGQLISTGEYDGSKDAGAIIGTASTGNATTYELTNIFNLASTQYIGTQKVQTGEVTLELSNIIDTTWLETNLPDFDFTTTWEIKTGAARPTLKDFDDNGEFVLPEIEFVIVSNTVNKGDEAGQLVITVKTNLEAKIYYIIVAKDAIAPTIEQIKAGVNYGDVVVIDAESLENVTELSKTHALKNATEYDVYFYAETATASVDAVKVTGTSKELIEIPLFGGKTAEEIAELGYYPIYNLTDLEAYRDGVNNKSILNTSTFKLEANIDMSTEYGAEGKNWTPIGFVNAGGVKWKGTFDGQNYTINGLYIVTTLDNKDHGSGFFGTVDPGAVVKNVKFTNVYVEAPKLVGTVIGYGKPTLVENVSVDGGQVISTAGDDSRVGGLIGRLAQSSAASLVRYSWTNVTVTGFKNVGGLIGHTDYSADVTYTITISDVYTLGDVIGIDSNDVVASNIGGIVGDFRGRLERAVAYGNVNGPKSTAGLAGLVQNPSKNSPDVAINDLIAFNTSIEGATTNRVAYLSEGNNGTITEPTNLFALDTLVNNTDGVSVTEANLIDEAWLKANTNFDMDTVWQIVEGKIVLR